MHPENHGKNENLVVPYEAQGSLIIEGAMGLSCWAGAAPPRSSGRCSASLSSDTHI